MAYPTPPCTNCGEIRVNLIIDHNGVFCSEECRNSYAMEHDNGLPKMEPHEMTLHSGKEGK